MVFQVETLLEQLDTKFDDMSKQILDRSEQVDSLIVSETYGCFLQFQ